MLAKGKPSVIMITVMIKKIFGETERNIENGDIFISPQKIKVKLFFAACWHTKTPIMREYDDANQPWKPLCFLIIPIDNQQFTSS